MTAIVESLGDTRNRVLALMSSRVLHASTEADLVDAVTAAGDLLRAVEGLLTDGVAELMQRSDPCARDERLTTKLGCRSVSELVQRLTRCSTVSAARLSRAAMAVAARFDPFTGAELPAALPALRTAMVAGAVGVDGVLACAQPLAAMRNRAAADQVLAADEVLAAFAQGKGPDAAPPACADLLRLHAQAWAAILDQDGAEPTEREAALHRGVTLGRPTHGVVPIRGGLLPDVAAQLQRIFDATCTPKVRFTDTGALDEPPVHDDRTRAQKHHDALAMALTVAAASRDLPTIGGAAPTLVISVRDEDLVSGHGWAHAEGTDAPLDLAVARHVACAGVVQRVALGAGGRITRLGTEERVFNRHQRRAIALRDGGCVIPGCGVAAGWCEIHHVTEHARGGPTHTDNGVLLCWHHHRFIDTGPWSIRMNRGVPEVKAPVWIDPEHRWRPVTTSRTRMLDAIGRRT